MIYTFGYKRCLCHCLKRDDCNISVILTPLNAYLRNPSAYDNDRKTRLITDLNVVLSLIKNLILRFESGNFGDDYNHYYLNIIDAYNECQNLQTKFLTLPNDENR
jgi:hypothetical protein